MLAIRDVRVMDARKHNDSLGIVSKRHRHHPLRIDIDGKLEESANECTRHMLAGHSTGNRTCLIVVHDLYVDIAPEMNATVYMHADVFLVDGRDHRLVTTIDTLVECYPRVQVTGLAASALLKYALEKAGTAGESLAGPSYTEGEAIGRYYGVFARYPFYCTNTYKEGLYRTADQLLNNQPDTVKIYRKEKASHVGRHRRDITSFYYSDDGSKGGKIGSFVALYDKGEWWDRNREGKWHKMAVRDGNLYSRRLEGHVAENTLFVHIWLFVIPIPTDMKMDADGNYIRHKYNGIYRVRFNPEKKEFSLIDKLSR